MKKTLITLTAVILMLAAGPTGYLFAGENAAPKGAAAGAGSPGPLKQSPVSDKAAEDEKKALEEEKAAEEARKAEEAKKAEEARKAAEEAKKIIVAKVNGEEITMFMLTRAMNRVAPKYVKQGEDTTPETTAKIRSEALDRLIFEELAVQEAIKEGINPTSEEIDRVVKQVMKNLGSEEAYKEYLDKNNLTEDALKKLIERSQRLELITAKEVYGKIKVDEKLLQDEYEKEKERYILPENFAVEDVWFPQGKDEETTGKRAEEVLKTIRKNQDDVWKLVQDGTFLIRKISVKKERYPEIYKAMADMKVKDLSGVIKEKDGFHIIKVLKKEPSRPATFEEARPTIEPKFLVPAQDERRHQWEKELKENAKIEIVNP